MKAEGFIGIPVVMEGLTNSGELYMDEAHLTAGRSAGSGKVYGKFMLVRPLRPGRKNLLTLLAAAVLSAAGCSQEHGSTQKMHSGMPEDDAPTPTPAAAAAKGAAFDFYLLALSSHPAFCADGHSRKAECRAHSPPLAIHGLWPERLQPGQYPHDCPGPPLELAGPLEATLITLMPGMADGLHEHEWHAHGTCTGLDDDRYFGLTYAMALDVDRALGAELTTLAGRQTSAAALRDHADAQAPGMGSTLTFHCRTLRDAPPRHRREPYLVEIRRCIAHTQELDGIGAPISCASVKRRDQGCGAGFRIAP